MKFGICGYGNLGRAVEKLLISKNLPLVGIFSRRGNIKSEFNSPMYLYEEAKNFEGKIDVMIMCGGSERDLLVQSPEMLKYFNIIDSFDTHAKIEEHRNSLESVAKKHGHVAIFSAGWDPGIFSLIRVLGKNIFGSSPVTFWGKGISQGHSEALRNIEGVKDAVQFTIPNEVEIENVRNNFNYTPKDIERHKRVCYIALTGEKSKEEVADNVFNTENYFKGQNVELHFCDSEEIERMKKNMHHEGKIFARNETSSMNFNLSMDSNPDFTANVMLSFALTITKLNIGAYSVLDIPLSYLDEESYSLL